MNRRFALLLCTVGIACGGCVSGPMSVAAISPEQSISEALQNDRSRTRYEVGPTVSAKSCETAILGLIPVTPRATESVAVRAALDSTPGRWNVLVDAELTHTQYPYVLARTLCWEAAGKAARRVTNRVTSTGRRR